MVLTSDPSLWSLNTSMNTSANHTLLGAIPVWVTPEEWQQRVHTTAVFAFFGSWGIILNALPILLTICTSDLRSNNVNIMVANLSTADLLFSVLFVFGQPWYILYREQLNPIGCQWLAFANFLTAFFEFMFPPLLAINRYISLYHNQYYERIYTGRNITLMIAGCWAFCTIVPLIYVLNGIAGFDDDNIHCCIVVKRSPIVWTVFYWLVIIIPLVAFCDGTMMYCNYKIYKKLTEHSTAQQLKNNVVNQNLELFYFLMADMMFPIMFHTTHHVAKFISIDRTDLIQRRVFICLYLMNSCVRGLITLTMLRPYRRALKNLLSCACCKSGSNTVGPSMDGIVGQSGGAHSSSQGARAAREATYN